MGTYITPTGFARKTLQTIKQEMEDDWREEFGADVDVSPTQPDGQFIGLIAQKLALVWEGLQEIYASHDVSQATDSSLNVLGALVDKDRIEAAPGTANCLLYATLSSSGTIVAAGKQVRRVRGGVLYSLLNDVTITPTTCRDIYLWFLDTLVPGDTVTLATSFASISVIVPSTGLVGLYNVIISEISATDWTGTATLINPPPAVNGSLITNELCLRLLDTDQDFSVASHPSWSFLLVGSSGNFQCDVDGPETAEPGEIVEIATPVTGWSYVYNHVPASPGRYDETDDEYRLRIKGSGRTGNATEDAIESRLLNEVPGIISATVTSNRNGTTNEAGLPGKSFEAVVQGGLNEDIGQVIWDAQPAGIQSYGNVDVDVTDSNGYSQTVSFSRPVSKYLYLRVRYYLYAEESFPLNGNDLIKQAILDWASTEYQLGTDVIPQRINIPIYSISGVGSVEIQTALMDVDDGDPTPLYTPTSWTVEGREVVVASIDRMDIERNI